MLIAQRCSGYSLVYKAVQMPQYAHFLPEAKAEEKGMPEPGK